MPQASPRPVKLFFEHGEHIKHKPKQIQFWKAQTPFLIIGAMPAPNSVGKCICVCLTEPELVLLPTPEPFLTHQPRIKYGTLYDRSPITANTTEFEIMSEPFVNNESWGYCPVIHVRTRTGQDRYIQVGARSIRDVLENLRSGDAGLTGLNLASERKTRPKHPDLKGFVYKNSPRVELRNIRGPQLLLCATGGTKIQWRGRAPRKQSAI